MQKKKERKIPTRMGRRDPSNNTREAKAVAKHGWREGKKKKKKKKKKHKKKKKKKKTKLTFCS
jgi:hypothetical protein